MTLKQAKKFALFPRLLATIFTNFYNFAKKGVLVLKESATFFQADKEDRKNQNLLIRRHIVEKTYCQVI